MINRETAKRRAVPVLGLWFSEWRPLLSTSGITSCHMKAVRRPRCGRASPPTKQLTSLILAWITDYCSVLCLQREMLRSRAEQQKVRTCEIVQSSCTMLCVLHCFQFSPWICKYILRTIYITKYTLGLLCTNESCCFDSSEKGKHRLFWTLASADV